MWQHHRESGHVAVHHRPYHEPATFDTATDSTPGYDTCPSWPGPAAWTDWCQDFLPPQEPGSTRRRFCSGKGRLTLWPSRLPPEITHWSLPGGPVAHIAWQAIAIMIIPVCIPYSVCMCTTPGSLSGWVGAPESARLLCRPLAEWLQVMNRRDTLHAYLGCHNSARGDSTWVVICVVRGRPV